MAKGKHATALFEVIHGDRRADRNVVGSGALRTPKWWFKGRPAGAAPAPAVAPPDVTPPTKSVDLPIPQHTDVTVVRGPSIPMPRLNVAMDSDRQLITFHLTYTTAILAGFALIVLIVLTYMVGRHGAMSPRPVLANRTSEEIRSGPVQAGVLEPHRSETAGTMTTVVEDVEPTPAPQPAPGARPQTWNDPRPPATLVVDGAKRDINLNYVIVQSYPDEKNADDARDLLVKNGIPCTVEKCPPDWGSRSWFIVIGTQGFNRLRNSPQYDAYIRSIEDVSAKFAGSSKFKKFEPKAYKWKDAK